MKKYRVLYNPFADNGNGKAQAKELLKYLDDGEVEFCDMTQIPDYGTFLSGIKGFDPVVLVGGDGTLNRFINETDGVAYDNPIYYYAAGTGNDFWRDLGKAEGDAPVQINDYLRDLPTVTVNGKRSKFLNGVGYGIDGYCCQVGDELRRTSAKKVDYTAIAIKGLLIYYHPVTAEVEVDGKKYTYKKAWLSPVMHGRFYGGGMMPTPNQDRKSDTLSVMVMHGSGKLRTLAVFPSIFKGEHIKHEKTVAVHTGKKITVKFDRPTPLQIDGETVLDVTEMTCEAAE